MYLQVQLAEFACPRCAEVVRECVVTHTQTVFTAPAMAMHRGMGHTAVLAGKRWMVRCGEERSMWPLALVVGDDKVLRAPERTVPVPAPDRRQADRTSAEPAPPGAVKDRSAAAKRRP